MILNIYFLNKLLCYVINDIIFIKIFEVINKLYTLL